MVAGCLRSGAVSYGAVAASGAPDLEGTWTNASLTHFERPAEYGNRGVLSQREVEVLEKKNSDLVALGNKPTNPKATVKDLPADCSGGGGGGCNYNTPRTRTRTTARGGSARRALPHFIRLQRRSGHVAAALQQYLSNCAGQGYRRDRGGNGSRRSDRPLECATSQRRTAPVVWRFSRPLRRRHAGGRNHEFSGFADLYGI